MSKTFADDELPQVGARPGTRAQARRQARLLAFQTLYEVDVARHPPGEVLQRLAREQGVSEEVESYARELVAGVLQHRRELDEIIQERAPAWPLAQMSAVDRNILRLGLFEVLHQRDKVPVKVAINEAVELAKTFGSDSSARFVNGVLGRAVEQLVPSERPAGS